MAVLYRFRAPALCRHVHDDLLRSALLDLTLIIPVSVCHCESYAERYSRFSHGQNQPRREVLWRGVWLGPTGNWDFRQCSFHHLMQVLRVCSFSTFALPPASPPCCCPLAFQRQVRRLTSRISSESYPGSPECVV